MAKPFHLLGALRRNELFELGIVAFFTECKLTDTSNLQSKFASFGECRNSEDFSGRYEYANLFYMTLRSRKNF